MGARFVWLAGACTLLGSALVAAGGCNGQPSAGTTAREVRVAAAADLKFALEDVSAGFAAAHPGVKVTTTYGSSGTLFAQLVNDAPFDVFLSADIDYPRKLVEQGKAVKGSEFSYAVGHLVVWVPNGSKLDLDTLGITALADPAVKKVAVANPRTAPYGRATEAALKSLGAYEAVRERLVFGENIAQAAQFVGSGAADAGLIALSLALAPAMRDKGRYWPVPLDAYPRLDQGGVILSGARDADAAHALRAFLMSREGRALLKRHGFTLPGE